MWCHTVDEMIDAAIYLGQLTRSLKSHFVCHVGDISRHTYSGEPLILRFCLGGSIEHFRRYSLVGLE